MHPSSLRIAWFAVLHPEQKFCAPLSQYFSRLVLPELCKRHDVEVFTNHFHNCEALLSCPKISSHHYLKAFQRHAEKPFHVHIYQLEDNRAADFIRIAASLKPGVSIFHDAYFRSMGPEPTLNSGWKRNFRKFHDRGSPWFGRKEKAIPEPMLARREMASSILALFTSERDHREYLRVAGERDFQESSVLGRRETLPSRCLGFPAHGRFRESLQLVRNIHPISLPDLRLGVHGTPDMSARAHKIFDALRRMDLRVEVHWLLNDDELAGLDALLPWAQDLPIKVFTSRTPEHCAEFLENIDVLSLLSHSPFGQLGPAFSLAMRAGKPVLVSDFASGALAPEALAFHIECGNTEASHIGLALLHIHRDLPKYQPFRLGQIYGEEFCSPSVVARDLEAALFTNEKLLMEIQQAWDDFAKHARAELLSELALSGRDSSLEREQLFDASPFQHSHRRASVFHELGWEDFRGNHS